MNKKKAILLLLILALASTAVFASVTKNWKSHNTHISGLDCKIEEVRTTSSEWLMDMDRYHFRLTDGNRGTVRVDMNKSTFRNCKVTYRNCYVSSSGEWTDGAIEISALNHDSWSYNLSYYIEYK